MQPLHYIDTRGLDRSRPRLSGAILGGQAAGGGLYVPERIPQLPDDALSRLASLPYADRAGAVLGWFGADFDPDRLAAMTAAAYGSRFDSPQVAPVRSVSEDLRLLELWHGPSAAFKDLALQLMPLLFSEAADGVHQAAPGAADEVEAYLVLVATSGDTGKAALEGFADRPRTRIAVFYPSEGVSELQRLQMVTQRGENVLVVGVEGDFDTCQRIVRALFADASFGDRLLHRAGIRLSSANSINWGRLLPQIAYYLSACADLAPNGGPDGDAVIDVCVPTGNFGNILAAWYARRMGAPIGRLICACNENNVLYDFIRTGTYDIAGRTLRRTPSPSMDILIASNLERLLFEVCRDSDRVRRWAGSLATEGRFEPDEESRRAIAAVFRAGWVANDDCLQSIRRVHERHGFLLDPHTAVAWKVAERSQGERPVLVVGTAHWAKFGPDVLRALLGLPWSAPLPAGVPESRPAAVLEAVLERAPDQQVPEGLATLEGLPVRFPEIVAGSTEAVRAALLDWLEV